MWYKIKNESDILTPAILFYPDRIVANIQHMIKIAGGPERLRPHVKTYKCIEIVNLQQEAGINKFKCATLREAEMLASNGVKDVILSYPLVGPAQEKFLELSAKYPDTKFATLVDHTDQLDQWQANITKPLNLYIDINVGMNRTGTEGKRAVELYEKIKTINIIEFQGLHVYDGHIRETDPVKREQECTDGYATLTPVFDSLPKDMDIVCGGSITFTLHAKHPERTLSPGTTLLWDYGYGSNFPDLPFEWAAVLMTRVVSKPSEGKICLELGHKAVASEMSASPVFFPDIPDAQPYKHSEEHLVISTSASDDLNIGQVVYGIPTHICPTVALHESAGVVQAGKVDSFWEITARNRLYSQ